MKCLGFDEGGGVEAGGGREGLHQALLELLECGNGLVGSERNREEVIRSQRLCRLSVRSKSVRYMGVSVGLKREMGCVKS